MTANDEFELRAENLRGRTVNLSNPETRHSLSPVAIRSLFNIAREWGLGETQMSSLLGGIPLPILHTWERCPDEPVLGCETLTRISLLLGIYKALHTYFGDAGDYWITHPNDRLFGGAIPIDYMIATGLDGMCELRRMLDGWAMGQ